MASPPVIEPHGHAAALTTPPASADFVRFAAGFGKRFLLVVDTEEEFNWAAPFARENRAVTCTDGMAAGQRFFARAGMRPLYVTDYPVATDPVARAMMAQWAADGAADVGAHLHPWVNPPFSEPVTVRNSFAGNLDEALERAKLTALRDALTEAFGAAPVAYRAGRYGIGPHSGRILADLGFRVDTSIRSRYDYSDTDGPDFRGLPVRPWWAGPDRRILELPLSTAWVGALRHQGDAVHPLLSRIPRGEGLAGRTRLLSRIPLTPEGTSSSDAIAAIDALAADGLDLLLLSFHSPSLAPGHTPYVRAQSDLDGFYRWWDDVLDHLAKRGFTPASLGQIMQGAGL